MLTRLKSKVELCCDFSLKVTRLCGTIQQMNILSAEVCSLEAVNSSSRNVQTQFIVCSLKLTFSSFIWFRPSVSAGLKPRSLNISFEWPWKWNRKWLDQHSTRCPPQCSSGESETCGVWFNKHHTSFCLVIMSNARNSAGFTDIELQVTPLDF